jgi:microcystin degradation protein MlrC
MSSQERRIAIGGFSHESNSFTGIPTRLSDFAEPSGEFVRGDELLDAHSDVNTVVSGLLRGSREHGFTPVPILYAGTCPGGPVEKSTYESIRDELIDGIAAQKDLSGVLLALHGAMVAEGYPDPEGDLLTRLRERIGDLPVGIVLDMHANLTQTIVDNTDVFVGYKTYPHVDLADSGLKAANLLSRVIDHGVSVTRHLTWLPVLLPSMNMRTQQGPMADLQRLGSQTCESDPSCLDVSIFGGFPYADVPATGGSVVVTTHNDQDRARQLSTSIASEFWGRIQDFWVTMKSPDEAVDQAIASPNGPVVLVDASDNPGSGGTGDTTTLLRLLIEKKARNATVAMVYDPETVAHAHNTGVGKTGHFEIGGKINPEHGGPVSTEAYVRLLSDGQYVKTGPMGHGQRSTLGKSAVLVIDGVEVVVSESRASVNDPEMLRILGIEPTRRNVLALKVKGHFRAAFGDLVSEMIDVDAPGASTFDVTLFNHQNVTRPIYPYDRDVIPSFMK